MLGPTAITQPWATSAPAPSGPPMATATQGLLYPNPSGITPTNIGLLGTTHPSVVPFPGSVVGGPMSPGQMGGSMPPTNGSQPLYQPGDFSKLAFQMAGSPQMGPLPSMAPPPGPPASPSSGNSNNGFNLSTLLPYLGVLGGLGLLNHSGGLSSILGGAGSGLSSLLGTIGKGIGSIFGGGQPSQSNANGGTYDPSSGTYGNGFTPGQFGAPDYSPYVSAPGTDTSQPVDPTAAGGIWDPNSSLLDNSNLFDTSGTGPSFSPAGGEAATTPREPTLGGIGNVLGDASSALGIYNGLRSGTVTGDIGAGLGAANLARNTGLISPTPGMAGGLGAVGGALNMYNGLKQGGIAGDTQAALGAAQTYAGASALDSAAGGGGFAGGSAIGAYAGPIGLALAPALYGASQPGITLGSTWYNNFGNTLSAGMNPGATPEQKLQASSMLQQLGLMQMNGNGGSDALSTTSNFNFGRLMDVLKPYGVTNLQQAQALANQLINSIPPGQIPTGRGVGGLYVNQA